jgi:hypothetical protein
MKTLIAILALCFSSSAFAVDMTITFTSTQATRVAADCGAAQGLVDTQTPPQPRACTMTEAKAWVINLLRLAVWQVERQQAQAAIVNAPMDPQ